MLLASLGVGARPDELGSADISTGLLHKMRESPLEVAVMNPAQKYALDVEATRRRYRYHDAVNETSWAPTCFMLPAEFEHASEEVMQAAARAAKRCIDKAMNPDKR